MLYQIHRYPAELIDVVWLPGGRRVVIRPVLPQDEELTTAFFARSAGAGALRSVHEPHAPSAAGPRQALHQHRLRRPSGARGRGVRGWPRDRCRRGALRARGRSVGGGVRRLGGRRLAGPGARQPPARQACSAAPPPPACSAWSARRWRPTTRCCIWRARPASPSRAAPTCAASCCSRRPSSPRIRQRPVIGIRRRPRRGLTSAIHCHSLAARARPAGLRASAIMASATRPSPPASSAKKISTGAKAHTASAARTMAVPASQIAQQGHGRGRLKR